jgi:tyrosine-protein kinase Etk/Wzc
MVPETIGEHDQELQGASAQEVHLLPLLIILHRRRRFVFFFTVGAAVLAVVTVLLIPSRYTAETTILPPAQNSSMSSALLGQLGGSGALASAAGASLGIKNPGDMYVSLLRSRTVEDSVIQRFGLTAMYRATKLSDARRNLENRSTITLGIKDGLIRIDVSDRAPNTAAEIANGYVEAFRKLSASLAITEASQRRVFFEQQLLDANQNLAAAEEAMKRTEQSTGVLQVDSQARSLIESAAILRGQIVAKEVQLQGMRSYATEDNPQMVTAGQQLAELKAQLATLAGTGQNPGSDFIVSKGNIPEAGMEYIRKLRDVKYYETITELIAKQFEMAKLDEARQGSVIQVVDIAVPPDRQSFPKRVITVIAATMLAFITACGWCIAAAGFQRLKPKLREIVNPA